MFLLGTILGNDHVGERVDGQTFTRVARDCLFSGSEVRIKRPHETIVGPRRDAEIDWAGTVMSRMVSDLLRAVKWLDTVDPNGLI